MSEKPGRLAEVQSKILPGIGAIALFVVMAVTFARASFPMEPGFPEASVTAAIGMALLNLELTAGVPAEGFLVPLIIFALLLDAALDGAVHMAKRDEDGDSA